MWRLSKIASQRLARHNRDIETPTQPRKRQRLYQVLLAWISHCNELETCGLCAQNLCQVVSMPHDANISTATQDGVAQRSVSSQRHTCRELSRIWNLSRIASHRIARNNRDIEETVSSPRDRYPFPDTCEQHSASGQTMSSTGLSSSATQEAFRKRLPRQPAEASGAGTPGSLGPLPFAH